MAEIIADRVLEQTTSTGSGNLTLGGTIPGYRGFATVCAQGDTFYGTIVAVDANGTPSGEWEVGYYTYAGGNAIQRTAVSSSSNGNARVNFGPGTKRIFIDVPAFQFRQFSRGTTTPPQDGGNPGGGGGGPGGGGDPGGEVGSSDIQFATSSFWYSPIPANAPLDPNSANFAANIAGQLSHGAAKLNTYDYTGPVYFASPSDPRYNFGQHPLDGENDWSLHEGLAAQFQNVPVPSYAERSAGTDKEMIIYDPSTGTLWEFWQVENNINGNAWSARWGGRIENVAASNGIYNNPYGASATGLPFTGGQITAEELQAGEINHVIGIALNEMEDRSVSYSWPANRSDGWNPGNAPNRVPQGRRLRLDPSFDVDGSNLHPVAKIIAKAGQKYGFVVWDFSGVITMRVRNAKTYTAKGLADPYLALYNGAADWQVLDGFPWGSLQVLPHNYGFPGTVTSTSYLSTLTDTFNDNSRDPSKWVVANYEQLPMDGVNVGEANGRVEISLAANRPGDAYSGYRSANAYNMTGSGAFVRLAQAANVSTNAEAQFGVAIDRANALLFLIVNGTIQVQIRAGAVTGATPWSDPYDPVTHAWLRVRESGGSVFFETASVGASNPPASNEWVVRHTEATPIPVGSVYAFMVGGTWESTANPGTVIFDGFNAAGEPVSGGVVTPPAGYVAPHGHSASEYPTMTFRDEFDGGSLNSTKWPLKRLWYEGSGHERGNFEVANGRLRLWAQPWNSSTDGATRYPNEGGDFKNHNITLCTDGAFRQRYGYFETRAKMPYGSGIWPGFWLYGHQDAAGNELPDTVRPEIDTVEVWTNDSGGWSSNGNRPNNYALTVWNRDGDQVGTIKLLDAGFTPVDLSAGFHTYGVRWDSTGVTFYFDGQQVGPKIAWGNTHPLYMLCQYWIGGASGAPIYGQLIEGPTNAVEFEYVRAWALADGTTQTFGLSPAQATA